MTEKENSILYQIIKWLIGTIATVIVCTATFVYKGAIYSSRIDNNIGNNTEAIKQLRSEQKVTDYRVYQLELEAAKSKRDERH